MMLSNRKFYIKRTKLVGNENGPEIFYYDYNFDFDGMNGTSTYFYSKHNQRGIPDN